MESKTALLFPGQGSQLVGMGKEMAAQFSAAREVFDEVDAALGEKLSALMFEGPQETLTMTENAQPAIMAVSMAVLRVLQRETGFEVAKQASYVAGHSLGEYSALCAAGSLTLSDTAKLLRLRGKAMQQAVPKGQGAMAALIGADFDGAKAIAKEAELSGVCTVANDNAPGQVVISGSSAAIDRAIEIAKTKGVKRAMLLEVSAPFHSPLMQPAAQIMKTALATAKILKPCVPLVANVTAESASDPEMIRQLLVEQVTGIVRWRESVSYLKQQGVLRAIEIGAGKVLSGLVKRIEPEIATVNIGNPQDLQSFAQAA
jgi:[acyl-carrier-protein] S-malonyltransferase